MTPLEVEMDRLRALRERSAHVHAAIERHRADVLSAIRETGQARVDGAMDPAANPTKEVEARCKKLEAQRLAAQSELDKLTPEMGPLAEAIRRIETGLQGKVHTEKLAKQGQVREAYQAVARRLLETANLLAELSAQARSIFESARSEFPLEEQSEGQEVVFRSAGLREIWDAQWINAGRGTRRDVVVGNIFDWNRGLVNEADPVSRLKRDGEDFFRRRGQEMADEQRRRCNPTRADVENSDAEAHARGETRFQVAHPLSRTGSWKV